MPHKVPPPVARLSRTVIALGVVSLLTDMSSEMVITQVPLLLTGLLGAPAQAVGLIEGVAESTASLLRLVSGYLSDKTGRRKPLTVLGYSFGAISKPLMAGATVWPLVLLWRFVDRFGKGLRTAPRDALIAESMSPAMRGRAFGLHRTMDTTGAVLGPLLGIWFLAHVGGSGEYRLRALFVFAGLPGLLAVLTLLFAVRERPLSPEQRAVKAAQARPPLLPRWHTLSPTLRRYLLLSLLFNLGNFSDAFLVLRAKSIGMGPTEILWLYAAFNVVEACLGYAAGSLSDRVGRKPLLVVGYVIFALVYAGFGFAHNRAEIWALFLLYGFYYTLTGGTQRAYAADLADPEQRATQIGLYHTIVGVALLPASVIAGFLFDWNPALPFWFGAATALLSALGLLFAHTHKAPLSTQESINP